MIKFHLLTTSTLVGFQENIQQFIPQVKPSLKGEVFIVFSTIIPNDNVYQIVFSMEAIFNTNLIFYENNFFNESRFSMQMIFKYKWFFNANNFSM
jgi:hypothetical protein